MCGRPGAPAVSYRDAKKGSSRHVSVDIFHGTHRRGVGSHLKYVWCWDQGTYLETQGQSRGVGAAGVAGGRCRRSRSCGGQRAAWQETGCQGRWGLSGGD